MSGRKIIHVDMDAYFASVEILDNPTLQGKPVAVGGDPRSRGVVAAASYEARRFGVRSAMPCSKAQRLCPSLIFVRPRMERYVEISRQIRSIFLDVTDLVEPLSLDEAYLDVTQNKLNLPLARDVARIIKDRILSEVGLTASAGVASNKFIAKVASDYDKLDGFVVVLFQRMEAFMTRLPVEKIWGVGPVTAQKLHDMDIRTVGELRGSRLSTLESRLGKTGLFLHRLAHGDDPRPVTPHREARSRGAEVTLASDLLDVTALEGLIDGQAKSVSGSLRKRQLQGRTVTLKIRYEDFITITRSRTLSRSVDDAASISAAARDLLLTSTEAGVRPIRLVGVSVSAFDGKDGPEQLWLDLPLP